MGVETYAVTRLLVFFSAPLYRSECKAGGGREKVRVFSERGGCSGGLRGSHMSWGIRISKFPEGGGGPTVAFGHSKQQDISRVRVRVWVWVLQTFPYCPPR